ncbi:GWxTD domain-containing protein [Balneolaceae bacterium YR4-1]|uniref:GWxTD domain-containing protein n=1 Tax=Halalkalibaculum roseum TaxID=2709311 RepID=A0A6M1SMD4_9BACT|nr:GWxTD domain-containing protein [Halalkalibaculum roseum]
MNILKKISATLTLVLLFTSLGSTLSFAQGRVSYQELAARNQQQNLYFDFFTLPSEDEGNVQFVTTFRIDYNFLPFKKSDQSSTNRQFYSPLALSMEVFKALEKKKPDDRIKVEGLESVSRTAWRDTAFAESYEQTQSNKSFISGFMKVELNPGLYNYMLQLTPGEDTRERTSRVRQIEINPYNNQKKGDVLLIESVSTENGKEQLTLMNFAQNVYYGKDFYALIHLPDSENDSNFSLTINKLEINREDTTRLQDVYTKNISKEELRNSVKPVIQEEGNEISLSLNKQMNAHNYALVKVPNSTFPNSIYSITVKREGQARPVAQRVFRSLWIEMPTSLLNLEVAIDMLRFIVSKDEIKRIKSGSQAVREQKFREFWESKDPTPNTEYNELMAEYYRRIDYAYEHFTTINNIGYESDQGEIYIKYGPPKNIERKFPTGEPAVEIWTYENRQFVFRATSGFGDFRLVSR